MEIDSTINNSNYMYIRDATKKFLGSEVKYLTTPNCIIVYNKDVKHSELVTTLKHAIRELKLIEQRKDVNSDNGENNH